MVVDHGRDLDLDMELALFYTQSPVYRLSGQALWAFKNDFRKAGETYLFYSRKRELSYSSLGSLEKFDPKPGPLVQDFYRSYTISS